MKNFKPLTALFTFSCVFLASASQAVILDFEAVGSAGGGSNNVADGYIEDGFQFLNLENPGGSSAFAVWQSGSSSYAGSTALFCNQAGNTTRLTQTSNAAFDLASIDLACVYLDGGSQSITFTGTKADNSTVTDTFTLSNPNVLTTFAFTNMTNIVKMEWAQNSPYHQFDNIVTGSAVPEPASLAALGLGALALVRRRKLSR